MRCSHKSSDRWSRCCLISTRTRAGPWRVPCSRPCTASSPSASRKSSCPCYCPTSAVSSPQPCARSRQAGTSFARLIRPAGGEMLRDADPTLALPVCKEGPVGAHSVSNRPDKGAVDERAQQMAVIEPPLGRQHHRDNDQL